MPNRKYEAGRRKEWKIRKSLLKNGYDIAQRSAGSHSPIDIFAICKEDKTIALVQSKGICGTEAEKKRIEKKFEWLNGTFKVEFWVE